MMEGIRGWLTAVVCAALILALAEGLMPAGPVKKVGRLTGGLVMFLAMVSPLAQVDLSGLSQWITVYRTQAAVEAAALTETNEQLLESIIAEETASYIEGKAAELGLSCAVRVTCRTGEEGLPIPSRVEVTGALTGAEQDRLARLVEEDLAIPREAQTFTEGAE